jgi:hypothetical protein
MSTNGNNNGGPLGLQQLFARATLAGTVSTATQTLLSGDLGDLVLAGASGMDAVDITASDVTLVTLAIDASSSIGGAGLEDAVRMGQRMLLDAFAGAKEKDSILVALWLFASDATVVHSYVPVDDAVRLDATNYRAGGTTHLYDTTCDALAANIAYAQTLRDAGTPTRSVLVVLTDGEDVGSRRPARAVKRIVDDVLKSEQFVVAFVGVGKDADFTAVATSMGVPAGCILVQKDATPQGLRSAFAMVSRSAIRASQGRIQPGTQARFFGP